MSEDKAKSIAEHLNKEDGVWKYEVSEPNDNGLCRVNVYDFDGFYFGPL